MDAERHREIGACAVIACEVMIALASVLIWENGQSAPPTLAIEAHNVMVDCSSGALSYDNLIHNEFVLTTAPFLVTPIIEGADKTAHASSSLRCGIDGVEKFSTRPLYAYSVAPGVIAWEVGESSWGISNLDCSFRSSL